MLIFIANFKAKRNKYIIVEKGKLGKYDSCDPKEK